jgi:hypothetical protein
MHGRLVFPILTTDAPAFIINTAVQKTDKIAVVAEQADAYV